MLDDSAYEFDTVSRVFVRAGARPMDYADGGEAYVEQVLRDTESVSDYPVELEDKIRDWPSEYHLSHQRVNLLDAIAELIRTEDTVLELGAGTGILTRWLAERCRLVDAVEGSLDRARIARIRSRDNDNTRVFSDDISSLPTSGTAYDMVTLTGVLEYVTHGSSGDPWSVCRDMLQETRDALSEEGMLVLAIENRLGMKYWAGCLEDHTGRQFDGILGYPTPGTAVTWSRNELEALLRESGYTNLQFYHLFPDYKLPTLFMRECDSLSGLSALSWVQSDAREYLGERQHLFSEPLALDTIERAGLLEHFSNSFLVLASPSGVRPLSTEWLIRKYSNKHAPRFHHTVSVVDRGGQMRVERKPIYAGVSSAEIDSLTFSLADSDHVSGRLVLRDAFRAFFSTAPRERLLEILSELRSSLLEEFSTGEKDEEGFAMVDGAAVDYTLWNLVRQEDGSLVFVDRKWSFSSAIPEDYVMFRNVIHFLDRVVPYIDDDNIEHDVANYMSDLYAGYGDARLSSQASRESRF